MLIAVDQTWFLKKGVQLAMWQLLVAGMQLAVSDTQLQHFRKQDCMPLSAMLLQAVPAATLLRSHH